MADINKSRELDEGIGGTVLRDESGEVVALGKDGDYRSAISSDSLGDSSLGIHSGTITVPVDLDVSYALTGLKAVQREAKAATKALRELETLYERLNSVANDPAATIPWSDVRRD